MPCPFCAKESKVSCARGWFGSSINDDSSIFGSLLLAGMVRGFLADLFEELWELNSILSRLRVFSGIGFGTYRSSLSKT